MPTENQIRDQIRGILDDNLGTKYKVKTAHAVLYKLWIDSNRHPEPDIGPEHFAHPKRGKFAFQTDIAILNQEDIPLVVIEVKKNMSTHDILTYSSKAGKHKDFFPFLRYGMVSFEPLKIPRRFFVHNSSLDFCLVLNENIEKESDFIIKTVKNQIKMSNLMVEILENKKSITSYEKMFKTK